MNAERTPRKLENELVNGNGVRQWKEGEKMVFIGILMAMVFVMQIAIFGELVQICEVMGKDVADEKN